MRKEILWAIVIGTIFGLSVAFGAYKINSNNTPPEASSLPTPTPALRETKINISITLPKNGDIVSTDSVEIVGTATVGSMIVVSDEKGDHLLEPAADGNFRQTVDLASGVNRIKATAIDRETRQQIASTLLVVYSSAFDVKPDSKAYMGVVTDIVDSTIQIKNLESEIKQISTQSDQITVVNTKGTTNKTVKLTDIAIGDFIVAMGKVGANSVLSAERILITIPVTDAKIAVSQGSFEELSDTPDKNTSLYSYQDGKVTVIRLRDIEDEDQIISVSNTSLRTVFVLQSP